MSRLSYANAFDFTEEKSPMIYVQIIASYYKLVILRDWLKLFKHRTTKNWSFVKK